MAKFKIVTTGAGKTDHSYEMETLANLGAEIVEVSGNEDDLIKAVADADAIYGKGRPRITAKVIEAGKKLKVVSLGSVGVDSVDVDAATSLGIPVTNVPDTFIEEVADHAMTLILASWRRLVEQDRMVRKGEWAKARPHLYQFPRLMGMTLGFISLRSRRARAVAKRAAPFGFQMLAYDPYIEELVMSDYGVQPVGYDELLQRSDIISMHAPGTKDAHHLMKEQHFRKMKKTWRCSTNTGRSSIRRRAGDDQGASGRLDRGRGPRRARDAEASRPQQQSVARYGQRDPDRPRGVGLKAVSTSPANAGSARSCRWSCRASGRAPASIRRYWRSRSYCASSRSRWNAAPTAESQRYIGGLTRSPIARSHSGRLLKGPSTTFSPSSTAYQPASLTL